MLTLLLAGVLSSLQSQPSRSAHVPKLEAEPVLDGKLDEPVWSEATVVDSFKTFFPAQGQDPSQATRVRMYRDDRHLHVAFEAIDAEPSQVRATFSDRDGIFSDDWVGVILDPFEDTRRSFMLFLNPYGIQADGVRIEDPENEDYEWDAVFFSAGRVTERGYEVEVTLPFSSFRFDPSRDSWGIQFIRQVPRNKEKSTWAPIDFAVGGFNTQQGQVTGMSGIPVPIGVETIPEVTTRAGAGTDTRHGLLTRDTGALGGGAATDLGVTAKITRGNLAADLAANPDFSQVESDAEQIGLNERFALYYGEKRPFFLEGREIFTTPWEAVYSRSIVDPVYGTKLSGKAGATTFALLHALDDSPAGSTVDSRWTPDAYGGEQALITALRANSDLTRDFQMGLLVTDKRIGESWNRVGGIDGALRFGSMRVTSQVLWSATDHPDETHGEGVASKVRFMGSLGKSYSWFSWYERVEPEFRAEVGFLRRVAYWETGGEQWYRIETGRKTGIIAIQPGLGHTVLDATDGSGDLERSLTPRLNVDWHNARFFWNYQMVRERFGGEDFDKGAMGFGVSGAPFKWVELWSENLIGTQIAYFSPADPYRGGVARVAGGFTLKPIDRVSVGLSWTRAIFSNDGTSDALSQLAWNGEDVEFDASVARLATQVFLTQSISARVIADSSNIEREVRLSALVSYRPGPGTVIYAGWQDARPTRDLAPGEAREDSRAVFVKLSWLFRG